MAENFLHFNLEPADNARLANLCGVHDGNIKALCKLLNVRIQHRGEYFRVSGSHDSIARAQRLLRQLYTEASTLLEPDQLRQAIDTPGSKTSSPATLRVANITARNPVQAQYLETIRTHAITFGVGASGTGKTFLAMACALQALAGGEVRRMVLVRPAVEAGESLGFLPGDPVQKVNPYLRPLQDALHEITHGRQLEKYLRNNAIELAPLAFMRGRTLAHSFVILDEAQNATRTQMLMFLTRLGKGSKCVVTGDVSQVDLPHASQSGLADILTKVADIDGCAVTCFARNDTMRHPVVARILQAYAND